jgi:hypothetical protein
MALGGINKRKNVRKVDISMLFHTWVIKNYFVEFENEDCWTPKGCLARGLKEDRSVFSGRKRGYKRYLRPLKSFDASESVLTAFDECWKEWQNFERKNN